MSDLPQSRSWYFSMARSSSMHDFCIALNTWKTTHESGRGTLNTWAGHRSDKYSNKQNYSNIRFFLHEWQIFKQTNTLTLGLLYMSYTSDKYFNKLTHKIEYLSEDSDSVSSFWFTRQGKKNHILHDFSPFFKQSPATIKFNKSSGRTLS